jgi:2-hydroxychromene-2-carboxylate isomerase
VSSAFYFDLASPLAYLAAERILQVLPGPVEWQPVLARELGAQERSEDSCREALTGAAFREAIDRRAHELGLQPLRWPEPFPFDSSQAMLAATYAKSIGRVVPFAQAAFRQAFAGGHDLERTDHILIAAAACEMHPQAVIRGTELRSVGAQLAAATAEAAAVGVTQVPTVRIDERLFDGPHALADAAHYRDQAAAQDGDARDSTCMAAGIQRARAAHDAHDGHDSQDGQDGQDGQL